MIFACSLVFKIEAVCVSGFSWVVGIARGGRAAFEMRGIPNIVNFSLGAPSASLKEMPPVPCLGGGGSPPCACSKHTWTWVSCFHPPPHHPPILGSGGQSVSSGISPESTHVVSVAGGGGGWQGPLTLFSSAPCSCLYDAFLQLFGFPAAPWGGLACLLFRSPLAGSLGLPQLCQVSSYPSLFRLPHLLWSLRA